MKRFDLIALTAAVVSAMVTAQPLAPARLVVMDLKSPTNEGVVLGDRLFAEFTKGGLYQMVTRDRRELAVKELGLVSADEPYSLTKVGQKLKADIVVGGSIGQLGDTWTLNLIAVDVASGKVQQQLTKTYKGKVDGLLLLADGFVKQVSAERAKKVKAVEDEKQQLAKQAESLKSKRDQLVKKKEQVQADLKKELEGLEKKKDDLDKEYQLTEDKIAAHDRKTEEIKAAGKKPASERAKTRELLVKRQADIPKKKESLYQDQEKARARAAKALEEIDREIEQIEKAQAEVAQRQAAFEPKPPEPEPAPAAADTVKKPEPAKKPVKKAPAKTKAPTAGGR